MYEQEEMNGTIGCSCTLLNPYKGYTEGTVIHIPANVKHWHGAASDSWFAHHAFEIPGEDAFNEWLESVSDEAYDKPKPGISLLHSCKASCCQKSKKVRETGDIIKMSSMFCHFILMGGLCQNCCRYMDNHTAINGRKSFSLMRRIFKLCCMR